MKFLYQYRTSDNKSHTGVINAASRDAAFAALKAQGVKPGRVEEAPGFFNKLFGKGKRWIAIMVLALIVVAAFFVIRSNSRTIRELEQAEFAPQPRHHIYGDPALIGKVRLEFFESVLVHEGDRVLAAYSQPGDIERLSYLTARRRKSVAALRQLVEDIKDGHAQIDFAESDPREIVELKRIILGMREELIRYLSNGVGTVESYLKRLEERQVREYDIYRRTKNELENEKSPEVWEKRNESLRKLGLPTLVMPQLKISKNTPLTPERVIWYNFIVPNRRVVHRPLYLETHSAYSMMEGAV